MLLLLLLSLVSRSKRERETTEQHAEDDVVVVIERERKSVSKLVSRTAVVVSKSRVITKSLVVIHNPIETNKKWLPFFCVSLFRVYYYLGFRLEDGEDKKTSVKKKRVPIGLYICTER